jgi:starch synthase (maltosyl-transferring)
MTPHPHRHPDRTVAPKPKQGRVRPLISSIRPEVDGGRYPAKAAIGELVVVEADVFADGSDVLACELRHRHETDAQWSAVAMHPLGNDRWRAGFPVHSLGPHRFVIASLPDPFATWCRNLKALEDAGWPGDGHRVDVELAEGASLLQATAARARGADRKALSGLATLMHGAGDALATPVDVAALGWGAGTGPEGVEADGPGTALAEIVLGDELAALARRYLDRSHAAVSDERWVLVDPERARFSAWYEMFPRSASAVPGRHGTLADTAERLDYVAGMGFDVLYLPPIHPIGTTDRKGPDGASVVAATDPGSPWAIGGPAGGHTAVHPELGTLKDLDRLVSAARRRGMDVALDLAFQCSPDHPWVRDHPEWFRHLPDGSIRCAENPPKRYEDIYPLDFDTAGWRELWQELHAVVEFWIGRGIRIFRVDNPHTKPLRFWAWMIPVVKRAHPEVIFLSEAFTRPKVMQMLAKVGFTQSYTYFAWRNSKWELQSYLEELVHTPIADYFRPNLWPNTPDILTEALQTDGPARFRSRLLLAATLSANYGVYGPVFELGEHVARHAGSEEYAGSEKYEIRHWDLDRPDSLRVLVTRVNRIRHENPALHHDRTLRFHRIDNDQILAYSKTFLVEPPRYLGPEPAHDPRDPNVVVTVVNLDPHRTQSGWLELDLDAVGIDGDRPYVAHDLLTDTPYRWEGPRNYVILDPSQGPGHVLRLHQPSSAHPPEPAPAPRRRTATR